MKTSKLVYSLFLIFCFTFINLNVSGQNSTETGLKISTFDIDVTPPVGSMLAYDLMVNSWEMSLRAKGIVLTGAGDPVVLVAVDWLCIDGESYDAFRKALAEAAGTSFQRVAIHTLHQHDAPRSNFGVEKILKNAGLNPGPFESTFQIDVINRLTNAVRTSLDKLSPVSHIGTGSAQVSQVASNRRIMGDNGKIRATRYTACNDPELRAEPEGLIDPMVSLISFWNNDKPIAVLSYYATHPQSYYRTGIPNPDFPGIARFYRQLVVPDALHIHFTGAGGNIGAGKYNDGSRENRFILAQRLADGMTKAWEGTKLEPVTARDMNWEIVPVLLPPSEAIQKLKGKVNMNDTVQLKASAKKMLWLQRYETGKMIDISCLSLGSARILHMPGELFVEYQLAAKKMRPDLFVVLAAYGDADPGYICTAKAYEEGGYEAGVSNVGPESEKILMKAIEKLLVSK